LCAECSIYGLLLLPGAMKMISISSHRNATEYIYELDRSIDRGAPDLTYHLLCVMILLALIAIQRNDNKYMLTVQYNVRHKPKLSSLFFIYFVQF
jgi:hypothetical protein